VFLRLEPFFGFAFEFRPGRGVALRETARDGCADSVAAVGAEGLPSSIMVSSTEEREAKDSTDAERAREPCWFLGALGDLPGFGPGLAVGALESSDLGFLVPLVAGALLSAAEVVRSMS